VSFTDTVFCCHGIDCNFSGGVGTLRKRLGLRREWLPPEQYRELCRKRARVHEAAKRLADAVRTRRTQLLDLLHDLNRLEALMHDAGPNKVDWDSLAVVYAGRPLVLAELTALESASATDLARFVLSDDDTQSETVATVLDRGGIYDPHGKWVEMLEG
jgi:hypothetical protein